MLLLYLPGDQLGIYFTTHTPFKNHTEAIRAPHVVLPQYLFLRSTAGGATLGDGPALPSIPSALLIGKRFCSGAATQTELRRKRWLGNASSRRAPSTHQPRSRAAGNCSAPRLFLTAAASDARLLRRRRPATIITGIIFCPRSLFPPLTDIKPAITWLN